MSSKGIIMRTFWLMLVATIMGLSHTLTAAPKVQSKIELEAVPADATVSFNFKVVPEGNMVINEDGPWRLDIQSADGVNMDRQKFEKADIDFKFPGWKVNGKTSATSGEIEYRATVFVCTKDKAQCFRDVHKGKLPWKVVKGGG
jgi:hypothetical protein